MPEYIVLRCYACQTFQSHTQRKDGKFTCKMCGEKQSVQKIYARSYKANDLTPIVRGYNMQRSVTESTNVTTAAAALQNVKERQERPQPSPVPPAADTIVWSEFFDQPAPVAPEDNLLRFAETKMREVQPARSKRKLERPTPSEETHWDDVDHNNREYHSLQPVRPHSANRNVPAAVEHDDNVEPPLKRPRPAPSFDVYPTPLIAQNVIDHHELLPFNRAQSVAPRKEESEWGDFLEEEAADAEDSELLTGGAEEQWEIV